MTKRSNTCRMSDDAIARFIELYRANDCLWDATREDYRSKERRKAAYRTISRQIGIAGFGPREVTRKIKYLRSVYLQEVRKVENHGRRKVEGGSGADGEYRSKVVWFDLLDDFLRNTVRRKSRDPETNVESKVARQEDQRAEQICISDPRAFCEKGVNVNLGEAAHSSNEPSTCPLASKRRKFAIVGERSRRASSRGCALETDDYESFGRYVAASLRRMPFEYGVSAESEIHDVIVKYKVYAMKKRAASACRRPGDERALPYAVRTTVVGASPPCRAARRSPSADLESASESSVPSNSGDAS